MSSMGLPLAASLDSFVPQTAAAGGPVNAGQVIDRIKAQVGVPWRAETVDTIVYGTPQVIVKGIATTMMATLDVVERAAAQGKNMVITHEPTFYSHQDTTTDFQQDATYKHKAEFLRAHDMVVFRFHDHWHARRPDGIATGMMRELGWEKQVDPANPRRFVFADVPLLQFVRDIEKTLGARTIRVIGDPALPVKRVAVSWGYTSLMPGAPTFARPDLDVMIVGESREWEVIEFAQDAIKSGQKKALIVVGHVLSEQSGMKYCAEWLRGFVPEVPVEFVAAPEPFWSPDRPVS
jgi:putative NIF3 family GTP cyclohydrolase 1 type 2